MTTGEKIRRARKDASMTQKELADALGVSESFVSQYETGKREPKYQTLCKIAEALGMSSPAYFVFDPVPDEIEKGPAPGEGEADAKRDELIRILSVLDPSEREQLLAHGRTLVIAHEAKGTDPKSP